MPTDIGNQQLGERPDLHWCFTVASGALTMSIFCPYPGIGRGLGTCILGLCLALEWMQPSNAFSSCALVPGMINIYLAIFPDQPAAAC